MHVIMKETGSASWLGSTARGDIGLTHDHGVESNGVLSRKQFFGLDDVVTNGKADVMDGFLHSYRTNQ
jgi:hypothetical protein